MARVEIHNEVPDTEGEGWVLWFQDCTYRYDDGSSDTGYRFIWRRPDGTLQAARGQARIPDAPTLYRLISAAVQAGWFSGDTETEGD